MQGLHVSVIVTRDSQIVSNEHVRDELFFEDGKVALAYEQVLLEWLAGRPDPNDVGSWRPRVVEVQVPVDAAAAHAAKLAKIIRPRDADLFPDEDPEAISAAAEHRPYDADSPTIRTPWEQAQLEQAAHEAFLERVTERVAS